MLDRFKIAAELFIFFRRPSLQVDIHGVHIGQQLFQDFRFRRAVRHQCDEKPLRVQDFRRVTDVFPANQRLVVSESRADISTGYKLPGDLGQPLRGQKVRFRLRADL